MLSELQRRKVLLFNVHRITYDMLKAQTDPGGLLALAAFLEGRGYDALVYQGEPSRARQYLRSQIEGPGVLAVGLYCDFDNQTEVRVMSSWIALDFGIPVLLGGPQVSGFDAAYLKDARCLAAVFGEGEIPLKNLLDCLFRNTRDWRELEGIVYVNDEGMLVRNPPGPVLPDLDELPRPAFHRWVNKPLRRKAYLLTGRGCPFHCAFCHEGSLSRPVRLRGVEHVLGEVEALLASEPELKYIAFADDTFVTSPRRVRAFCEGLSNLRERRDFVWYCEGHIKLLNRWPELLADMTRAGMARLQTGIESGIQEVLDAYGKNTTLDEIEKVVRAAAEAGVHQMVGFFITGGAFENQRTLERNKALCEKLIELAPGIVELGPSPLMPYPGTEIARCPQKFGIRILDADGSTTFSDYPVTETDAMTREEIARAQQELIRYTLDTMNRLFSEGKVPHERILNCFRDFSYGVVSVWHTAVYSVVPFVSGYYTLLARGAVRRSMEIPEREIDGWRPQRIMEMWHDVDFTAGYPRIGREVLSPLEFELLLYSTGKLRLKQVLDTVYAKFSANFENRREYEAMARSILGKFESRYWLAYAPL